MIKRFVFPPGATPISDCSDLIPPPWVHNNPLVLCGDYNATPETEAYQTLLSGLSDASFRSHPSPTFALAAPVRIDGILLHQLIPATTYAVGDVYQTKTSEPSDHLPLVTDLEFTSEYRENLQSVADLFREKNFREAIEQFEKLPQRLQNHTFGNAYRIIQGKVPDPSRFR